MSGHLGVPSTVHAGDASSPTLDAKNLNHQTLFNQETGFGQEPRDRVRVGDPTFSGGQRFGVGCAVVRRSPSSRGDVPPNPRSSSSSLSAGAIGGIAACAVLSILLILLGAFIWHRRERNQGDSSPTNNNNNNGDIESSKSERSFGTGPVVHHTPSLPALPPLRIPSPSNSLMVSVSPIESDSDVDGDDGERVFVLSNEDSRTGLVPYSNRPDGDQQGNSVESGSAAGPSKFVGQGLGETKREQEPRVVPSLLYPPAMTFDGNPNGWRQSLRPLPKPRITINSNLQHRTSLPDLRNVRMQVEGRLQDFGPAACPESFFPNSNVSLGDDNNDLLPPDYDQATEPFPDMMSVSGPLSPSSSGHLLSP